MAHGLVPSPVLGTLATADVCLRRLIAAVTIYVGRGHVNPWHDVIREHCSPVTAAQNRVGKFFLPIIADPAGTIFAAIAGLGEGVGEKSLPGRPSRHVAKRVRRHRWGTNWLGSGCSASPRG